MKRHGKSIYFNFPLSNDLDYNFVEAKGHDNNDVINKKAAFGAFLLTVSSYLCITVSGSQGPVMINEKCYFS